MIEPRLVHRDDISIEHLEQMEKSLPPGAKLICAGDVPPDQIAPEIHLAVAKVAALSLASLQNGSCIDCGARMTEEWPPPKRSGSRPRGGLGSLMGKKMTRLSWGFSAPNATNAKEGRASASGVLSSSARNRTPNNPPTEKGFSC